MRRHIFPNDVVDSNSTPILIIVMFKSLHPTKGGPNLASVQYWRLQHHLFDMPTITRSSRFYTLSILFVDRIHKKARDMETLSDGVDDGLLDIRQPDRYLPHAVAQVTLTMRHNLIGPITCLPPLFLLSLLRGGSVLNGCWHAKSFPKEFRDDVVRVARRGRFTHEEVVQLSRDNRRLVVESEILRRAAAYFAKVALPK